MNSKIERHTIVKSVTATAAVLSAFGLGACGGGGGGEPRSAADLSASNVGQVSIKVDGQATALSSDLESVMVVTPPVSWSADGSLPPGRLQLGAEYPASTLKMHAPGAYTTLPWGTEELSLSSGTVTDLAGNGHFAIGRWTSGTDSEGQSFNANQGRVWAIGAPLSHAVNVSNGMRCELIAATRPTTSDGNTAPGVLSGATAVVTENLDPKGPLRFPTSLTLRYSIGSDVDQTFTDIVEANALTASRQSRTSLGLKVFGPDAAKPYMVVSYGIHARTAGLLNGIAVLQCSVEALEAT